MSHIKVNLILLPYEETVRNPPISLCYIGALLKQKNYEVKLIDLNFDKEIPNSDFNVVASTTEDYYNCPLLNLKDIKLNLLKIKAIGKPLILIGPHGTSTPEYFQNYADYIVVGEPEITVSELIHAIVNKKNLRKIKGISFKLGEKIIKTKPQPFITNLDSLPFPNRSLLKSNKYTNPMCKYYPFTVIFTTRGCPYQCTFCYKGVYGNIWRKRNPDKVVEEIIEIRRKYKVRELWIRDDLFLLDKERIIKICDGMIKNNLNMSWHCQSRIDNIDENIIKKIKQAGCHTISLGIESGSSEIIKRIKKGINLKDTEKVVKLCKKYGIKTRGYFIIGFPGETKETIKQSFELAKKLDLDFFAISILTPYPNTEIFNRALEKKIIPKKENLWEASLRYAGQIETKFTFEQLVDLKRELYKRYYLRLGYILPRLNPSKIDMVYRGFIPFLKQLFVKKFRGQSLE